MPGSPHIWHSIGSIPEPVWEGFYLNINNSMIHVALQYNEQLPVGISFRTTICLKLKYFSHSDSINEGKQTLAWTICISLHPRPIDLKKFLSDVDHGKQNPLTSKCKGGAPDYNRSDICGLNSSNKKKSCGGAKINQRRALNLMHEIYQLGLTHLQQD